MQDYEYDWNPHMQTMCIPGQMYPVATMPEQQLEMMYPRIYHIIQPEIFRHCDMMDMTYGSSHIPTRAQLDAMIDDIYIRVEGDVNTAIQQEARSNEERQFGFGFGGRRLLSGLIGILVIRELLRRRRRPFYGFPYYGGYGVY